MPLFKKAFLLSLIIMFQSGASVVGAAAILDNRYSESIQQGVAVKGVQVGGLNPAEAAAKLESALPRPLDSTFVISNEGKSCSIILSDIDGSYDYLATAGEAFAYGKKGNLLNQLMSNLRLRVAPVDMRVRITFSGEKLADRIRCIQKAWDTPPKDAEIKLLNDQIVIITEKKGYHLDFDKTMEQARLALAGGSLSAEAAGRVLEPGITSATLEEINTLLAEYVTNFDDSAWNRTHNIALASTAVNGTLLKPGDVFSLNRRLGPRLAETGYLKAPAFIDNQLSLDYGGGVCQVATTLYNAALLADLTVIERYSHPSPVAYVPVGRDATIAGDYLDLKFINERDTPVYISSMVEYGKLTIRIFGAENKDGHSVRITSDYDAISPNIITYEDNTLSEGEIRIKNPGKAGYQAWVYRESIVDNQVKSRTQISSDYYASEDRVIVVGPKPKENGKENKK
ncbi:VanW family protein [Pelotomaculum terephthalicicum JT]|uniref:VanW family protein n=1 Tax=Pelotomaculum TaxID=191373 RepID=UPI0009C96B75|nr:MULTISPECIES: VanW family protein [Pelotomaculum]MCG9967068.1 VanW family protein [Pelotomaculum terephthalicicum JT]OPX89255.1 MAG: Vancomycin B-type resistance protein VanW [Pelotomaculum sp. PtaB.Bin117]OPY63886.1 MAG: Vancomycin B-type resistance protein VanW [Pelotomaculum sp. PtaU1.Bin065]